MEIAFQTKLEERVYRAAEAALVRQHYVCLIDVLCGMRLLDPLRSILGAKAASSFWSRRFREAQTRSLRP